MGTSKIKIANRLKAIRGVVKHNLSDNEVCTERLALVKCKEILNIGEQQYSDEEVLIIRDYLYQLAAIASEQLDIDELQNEQQAKVISLNVYKNNNNEKSDYLRTG